MLHVHVMSPATLTGQLAGRLAAASGVAAGSGFEHCGGIAIEGGAG
jgi:hypothetical protein